MPNEFSGIALRPFAALGSETVLADLAAEEPGQTLPYMTGESVTAIPLAMPSEYLGVEEGSQAAGLSISFTFGEQAGWLEWPLAQMGLLAIEPDDLLVFAEVDDLKPIWEEVKSYLSDWRQRANWSLDMRQVFGESWHLGQAEQLVEGIISGQARPQIELVPLASLQAKGAFAAAHNRLFLAEELLQPAKADELTAVLLEELGHFIDAQLNWVDSPGDEGAMFAALVQQQLSSEIWAALEAEDDTAELTWQGQTFAVEQASLEDGVLTVGASGQVTVQYVYDGGSYSGQVALFSLTGMENLQPGSQAFIQEAARRALSNSQLGHVVISERDQGAVLSRQPEGEISSVGDAGSTRIFSMQASDRIAVMLVPNGTVEMVRQRPSAEGSLRPLFSVSAANPGGRVHMGQLSGSSTGGLYGLEDLRFDQRSDGDYNDVIFRIEGATGRVESVSNLLQAPTWPSAVLELPAGVPSVPGTPGTPTSPGLPTQPGVNVLTSIVDSVEKFTPASSEAQIAASGAARITLGSRTVYIGTNQVSSINQNPIIASFDSTNSLNNWVRTDYEMTGADGRGLGLAWSGNDLYGIFSVDGAQGTANQDFRRASASAEQAWLRSYGQGGGPKVAVLGRIDLATGQLLDAVYLSAVLTNGNSNSLSITGLAVNNSGNLVVSAQSFFAPRRPNGQALTQVTPGSSPFAYTVELTPNLKRVVSTAAVGWT
ncbi:MAG: DUF4114 domain-containing protein [Cyanobacteria bacterium Co-bin8]|nr:DUF4114 domain-containing protein [Cyanobacteria bacterium Co-bin8]